MDLTVLPQKQKNKIISECINTRKLYRTIAKENDVETDDVYKIMDEYCIKHDFRNFRRTEKGAIFEKEDGSIVEFIREENKEDESLRHARMIEMPEEEKERIKTRQRILDLVLNTKTKYGKIADSTGTSIEEVYDVINEYCEKNNFKTIRRNRTGIESEEQTIKIKQGKDKTLDNAKGIEKWCDKNERRPRRFIEGVKPAKEGEKETEEQEEVRWGSALNNIRTRVVNKYEGKELEQIENEEDREIVRIIRTVLTKYENNKRGIKKKISDNDMESVDYSKELAKAIWNLVRTRKATVEQIRIIADYYGVDLEELKFNPEQQEDSLEER